MYRVDRLTVRGFKSIRELEDFNLRSLNVLIGPNGAGKSNFMGLFRLMGSLAEQRLQLFVAEEDGPDALLFGGREQTDCIDIQCNLGRDGYFFSLVPVGRHMAFLKELAHSSGAVTDSLGSGHYESNLRQAEAGDTVMSARSLREAMSNWRQYHFHNTSAKSRLRQAQALRDNLSLKPDGSNLAPFLRRLRERHPDHYRRIVEAIRLAAPFFGDFVYRKDAGESLELDWVRKNGSDTVLGPRQLSDGTLRFICLATLLLQPPQLQPGLILIDEPELGLHPFALVLLAEMLQYASDSRQIIVSTQSADLVNELEPSVVVVADIKENESTFKRLEPEPLREWLEDYAVGELWKMNILGGRPGP